MPVILIVMVSKHYENNFQPVSLKKWGRFYRKKDDWKFSVFRKTCFYGIKLIPAESPTLGESKYIHFILLFWPDQVGEPNMSHWLIIIPSLWNMVNFCVTSRPFFLIPFIIFTSLCLLLFVYISCNDYYTLITVFPHIVTLFPHSGH